MSGNSRSGGDRTQYDDHFPGGVLRKPTDLGPEESQIWDHIIEKIPSHLLRPADEYQLGVLVSLLARERKLAVICRQDVTDFASGRAYIAVAAAIGRLSAMYGLSPVDRKRFKTGGAEPTSDADDWQNS